MTYQLYFWDAPNYTWELYDSSTASTYPFVSSFTSGTITIFSNDYTNYENFSVRTKLVAIDERSGSSSNTFEDEFDLYLRDQCRDASITSEIDGFTGTEASPYSWHMWQLQEVTFTGITIDVSNSCPITYTITQDNAERTEETAVYSFTDLGSNTYKLAGTWTCCEVATRFYYIQAKVYNYLNTEQVAIDEEKYWIYVTNPCLRTDSIT